MSVGEDKALRVWRLSTRACVREWSVPSQLVQDLIKLDDDRFMTCFAGGHVQMWHIHSGEVRTILEPQKHGRRVRILDDQTFLAIEPLETKVLDTQTGELVRRLHYSVHNSPLMYPSLGHIRAVSGVLGTRIAVACNYRDVYILDVSTGVVVGVISEPTGRYASIAWANESAVACGADDGFVWVLNSSHKGADEDCARHTGRVTDLVPLDGCKVASASWDGSLRVWDGINGACSEVIATDLGMIESIEELCPMLLATVSGNTLSLWHLPSYSSGPSFHHDNRITALTYLGEDQLATSSYRNEDIHVWDIRRDLPVSGFLGHASGVASLLHLEHHTLVSGGVDGSLQVWDIPSRRILNKLHGHAKGVSILRKIDHARVISASYDYTLRVWNLVTGEALHELIGHTYFIHDVRVIDNERAVSVGADRKVIVWDTITGSAKSVLKGHMGGISCLCVIDQNTIATGSDHGELRVWDLEAQQLKGALDLDAWISAIVWLEAERVLAVGDDAGGMHFLEFNSPPVSK